MTNYTGKSIFQKVAIGKVLYYEKKENIVKRARIENVKEEIQRFEAAKVIALGQIDRIYQKALKEVGEENAAVFEVHMMMLEDDDYLESIYNWEDHRDGNPVGGQRLRAVMPWVHRRKSWKKSGTGVRITRWW